LFTTFGGANVRRAFSACIIDDPRINGRLLFGAEIDSRTARFGVESGSTTQSVSRLPKAVFETTVSIFASCHSSDFDILTRARTSMYRRAGDVPYIR
jgi:hypothetical protein